MTTRKMGVGLATLLAVCLFATPASAQLTTATVAGTVKDAQGGVIPGATVVLISEKRGTRTAPGRDQRHRRLRVPERHARHLHHRSVDERIQDIEAVRRRRSPWRPRGARHADDRGRRLETTVNVKAEAPLIQAQSGERSFTITTEAVQNLPISQPHLQSLAALAPGVSTARTRASAAAAQNNILDGIGIMRHRQQRHRLQLNVEAIAEVKVLTSGYQAEYGRSSGLQISAVTKSGTNQFRGSLYDVQRNSDWNANSWANKQNGSREDVSKQKDWGYSIGGPVGKPGGEQQAVLLLQPGMASTQRQRQRQPLPRADRAERQGDFSQSRDNNGALFPYIRDCTDRPALHARPNTAGCFQDGGVIGKIPANRLYGVGLNVLNSGRCRTTTPGYAATNSYNFVNTAAAGRLAPGRRRPAATTSSRRSSASAGSSSSRTRPPANKDDRPSARAAV